ncbi:unnamed protein product [Chondrus crispus]|uniref:Uncharacterized protein n=1 Tax=Chondrus crispus TaxID=2769 RepID=R7QED1_CHOCR|nr:unnamed protein product [Chondrus crispus]CDF36429.1 unnamed protein product [Chondrus crispus]|eukprot:XP_005716248.1 unnamed protein product [Chondrus crispus]
MPSVLSVARPEPLNGDHPRSHLAGPWQRFRHFRPSIFLFGKAQSHTSNQGIMPPSSSINPCVATAIVFSVCYPIPVSSLPRSALLFLFSLPPCACT